MKRTLATYANWHDSDRPRLVETGLHVLGKTSSPGRWHLGWGAYLLSNQEPTLDEAVQHFLTVAVGRLAGL